MNRNIAIVVILTISILLQASVPTAGSEGAGAAAGAGAGTGTGTVTQEPLTNVVRKDSINYDRFFGISEEGPVIPGLHQDYIPQGLAYYPAKHWMLISYYRKDGGPSLLSAVDMADGRMVKALLLYKTADIPYAEHAAGIAVSGRHGWIASGRGVYQFKLEDLDRASHMDKLVFSDNIRTETLGGFLSISDRTLWVGEFARYDFATDRSHHMENRNRQKHSAWVAGYDLNADDTLDKSKIDPASGVVIPDRILSVPDEIQGMAFSGDRIVLSKSYGLSNDSDLLVYRLGPNEEPHARTAKFGGQPVPIWFLDDVNLTHGVMAPPMSEGVFAHEGKLYVLFESGAADYLNSDYPIDRIYAADMAELVSGPPLPSVAPGALQITEVVVEPSDPAGAFRYVELYNDSGSPVDLSGHRIYYYFEPKYASPWEYGVDKFLIHGADTIIPPFDTKIVWMRNERTKTVQDFNRHYGTDLPESKFVYTDGGGFAFSGQRFFAIVGPKGDKIHDRYTFVRYNGDAGNGRCAKGVDCDFVKGESMAYFAPETLDWNSREMERRKPDSLHRTPTPGAVLPGQVPEAPAAPGGLKAQPWDGSAMLEWTPVASPSLGYAVYVNDRPVSDSAVTVTADTYRYRLTGLANGQTYKINVSTVRKGLLPGRTVESVRSPDLFVTPQAVDGLIVEGLPPSARIGQSYRTTVTAAYNGTPVFPVDSSYLRYTSSDGEVASVSPDGTVTAVDRGTAHISARFEGIAGTVRFHVSNGKNER
ncbi:lamin tail domain-containing protein [Paenibacillus sp. GYB003]|uniref:lamin tail domain-containing protein n=1 Tax=Paenibacillus sp. GYB003 TaxID=2994392 RepID=UPI002F96A507